MCLKNLLQSSCSGSLPVGKGRPKRLPDTIPLNSYAARHWANHYREACIFRDASQDLLNELGLKLVEDKSTYLKWLSIYDPEKKHTDKETSVQTGPIQATPLYYMSLLGVTGVARLLLEDGAEVEARGGHYCIALHAASFNGHRDMVKLLLSCGADVNARDESNGTALQIASWRGNEDVVRILLGAGAEIQ